MLNLRPAGLSDATLIANLGAQTFTQAFSAQMTPENIKEYVSVSFTPAQIGAEIKNPAHEFFIARWDEMPVGYAKLRTGKHQQKLISENPIELERLYVLEAYHQKKIGAALLEHCIQAAITNGHSTLWLAVWEKNIKAIRFYERWGFTVFDIQTFMRGHDAQTGLLMKKDL
jgi:GNAT superfamily N-acetyltransferase